MSQRRVFPAVALLVASSAALGLRLPLTAQVVFAAAAVLLFGVPHGALDVLHARDSKRLSRGRDWAVFLATYVATALAVVCGWQLAPSASLVGLLLISAAHFSSDLERGSPLALRVAHGAAPVCLPALLHAQELGDLFAALAPAATARWLASALEFVSAPLLLLSIVSSILCARRHRGAVLEVAATAAVCWVAPPLMGFAVYFCVLHSWRHVDRTRALYALTGADVARAAAMPTAATAAAAAAAWALVDWDSFEAGVLRVVFVGLAALTVPHMLLIERVRARGWKPRGVLAGGYWC